MSNAGLLRDNYDVDRQELADWLTAEGFDPRLYSLRGGAPDECFILNRFNGGWEVFYSERGNRNGQKWFKTEEEACEHLRQQLLRLRALRHPLGPKASGHRA